MRKMIIMLEDKDTRYEIYLQGIERSNIDNTIVGYETRYNVIQNLTFGASAHHGQMLRGNLDDFISNLISKGFEVVTHKTKKFA